MTSTTRLACLPAEVLAEIGRCLDCRVEHISLSMIMAARALPPPKRHIEVKTGIPPLSFGTRRSIGHLTPDGQAAPRALSFHIKSNLASNPECIEKVQLDRLIHPDVQIDPDQDRGVF